MISDFIYLTVMGFIGGLAFSFVLHEIGLPDFLAFSVGFGGMLSYAWWTFWDVNIKGRTFR